MYRALSIVTRTHQKTSKTKVDEFQLFCMGNPNMKSDLCLLMILKKIGLHLLMKRPHQDFPPEYILLLPKINIST